MAEPHQASRGAVRLPVLLRLQEGACLHLLLLGFCVQTYLWQQDEDGDDDAAAMQRVADVYL